MKYIYLFTLVFINIPLLKAANYHTTIYSDYNSIEFEVKLVEGIDAFYQTDWAAAREIFGELKKIYPEDPRPYFFESMMPFLEYFFIDQSAELADRFLDISEKAVDLSQGKLNSNPGDTTMVLMLSGLHGYRGLVAAGQNRHRVALSSGLTGFNYTRKLLNMDSDRPEARIGRGMFYYMVGSIPSGMRWATNMVGLRADIEDGFHELKLAAESESYIRNDAKMMLMYLYDKEGRYEEALEYALELTEALPDNVIFLFKKAEIYEKLNNNRYAADVYRLIIGKNNDCLKSIAKKSTERLNEIEKITLNR
jgi:tetratricopeptide (TPR) repeat protein